jgi:hypothetical protein
MYIRGDDHTRRRELQPDPEPGSTLLRSKGVRPGIEQRITAGHQHQRQEQDAEGGKVFLVHNLPPPKSTKKQIGLLDQVRPSPVFTLMVSQLVIWNRWSDRGTQNRLVETTWPLKI